MGVIADGIVAFAQPLIDATDGSIEQLNKALTIAQLCFNLALLPEQSRNEALSEMRRDLAMDDDEFAAFWSSVVVPMVRRHEEMFPGMHRPASNGFLPSDLSPQPSPSIAALAKRHAVTNRYAPCPCNSGKKYKFCCGLKGR